MSTKTNKAIVQRFIKEFQNEKREETALELLADNFIDRSPTGNFSPNKDGVIAMHGMLHQAFSGLSAEIHDQVAENQVSDRVTPR